MANKIYICYFVSYSTDNFFMKTRVKDNRIKDAETFCKNFVPDEYNAWIDSGEKFKYNKFIVYQMNDDAKLKIPLSFGEYYLLDPNDMPEYDVAYFSDQYSPELIIPD